MRKKQLYILKTILFIPSVLVFILINSNYIESDFTIIQIYILSVLNAIFVLSVCFFSFFKNPLIKKEIHLIGVINGLVMYVGFRFSYYDSVVPDNFKELLISIVYLAGAYFVCSYMLYGLLDFLKLITRSFSIQFGSSERIIHSTDKLWFSAITCLLIFACWLPYILIRYPAGIEWDASHQILQIVGNDELTNHWPVFSTYLMGYSIKIGKELFGSFNTALFVFAVIQSFISAAVLSYSLLYMKQEKTPLLLMIVALLVYSFIPLFPGYLTSIIKDALYSDAVLVFVILFSKYVFDGDSSSGKVLIFVIIGVLVCLLRNNGKYILFFTGLAGLFYPIKGNNKYIKKVSLIMLIVMTLTTISLNVYLAANNIPKGRVKYDNIRETLSIPFQQTARYLVYYPDDINENETEIINRVLDVEKIKSKYNPLLSDPVKRTFHADLKDLVDYIPVYCKMFFRHPVIYLDAALANSYGFFYPYAVSENGINSGIYLIKDTLDPETVDFLSIDMNGPFCSYGDDLVSYVKQLEGGHFSKLPCSIGFWTLLTIDLLIYAVYNKRIKLILVLIPSLTGILVCFASPTWYHGGFRYALPVVMSGMLLLAITIYDHTTVKT